MKKFVIALFLSSTSLYAGPESYSGKDMTTIPPRPPSWYAEQEWNVNLWAAYAFNATDNNRSSLTGTFVQSTGPGSYDRFLGDDHALGGGGGLKYFFHRYFGIGLEGFGLGAHETSYNVQNFGATSFKGSDNHAVGGALATFTLRVPIAQTRFAPYLWAGGGGIFDGRNETARYSEGDLESIHHERENHAFGQFGGGLEFRITPHVGLTGDFSWNVVDGSDNDFGLVRTGVTFAF